MLRFNILTSNQPFAIDRETGVITLSGSVDFESRKSYVLDVEASDEFTPPKTAVVKVTIDIIDLNDNTPVLGLSSYSQTVAEGFDTNKSLITVSATDGDRPSTANGQVEFALVEADTSDPTFRINATSGDIYANGPLDYEIQTSFSFSVYAYDLGTPSLQSALATVSIELTNVNNHGPIFSEESYFTK